MNKKDLFMETLRKTKDGNLYNYDNWLIENGIQPDQLNKNRCRMFFWAHPELMVNNEKEIEYIAKYIGSFLRNRNNLYHIPIIGVKGSGKTLLLNVIHSFVGTSGIGCNCRSENAPDLEKELQKQSYAFVKGINVLSIDQCNKVKEIVKVIEKTVKTNGNAVYLTFWTPESWINNKFEIDETLPVSKELYLSTIKKEDIIIFIERILYAMSKGRSIDNPYPDFFNPNQLKNNEFLGKIEDCTRGIPLIIIKLIIKCFEQTFLKKNKLLDMEILNLSLNYLGLCNLSNSMDELSAQHLKILETILLENSKKGARPIELVDKHNLDKSTISYHLNLLKKKEILDKEKIGKSSYYKIKENLIPFIQLKLIEAFQ